MPALLRAVPWMALALVAAPVLAQPLSLDDALRSGLAQSPRLAAQRHMLDAVSQQVGRASELPDPKLRLGIENLPATGPDALRYDRDFMTMRSVGFAQEFPNARKREARNLRAEAARDVEQASLGTQRTLLVRDIARAWLEVHFAERARRSIERLGSQLQLQIDTLSAGIARGRQGAADSFMLRLALEDANDRLIEQDRLIARARILLATFIGEEAKRPLGMPPDMSSLAGPRDQLIARLNELPELRLFERREELARTEVKLARSMKRSDWMLELGYGYRRPNFDNMLTVMVSIDLPWRAERRQDRDIASRLAEVEQARAMQEDARRMREAEVRGWLADLQTAERRMERFEGVLLPLARDRAAAALAAYQGGRGELPPVLEAERAITDTDLALVQALRERATAWANLQYLYPAEGAQ